MNRVTHGVALLMATGLLLAVNVAQASEPRPVVAVVIETLPGLPLAASLREQLGERTHCEIVSLSEAMGRGVQPAAMLTVSLDKRSQVSTLYLARDGKRDLLTAAVPNTKGAIEAAALALASALLHRHHPLAAGRSDGRVGPPPVSDTVDLTGHQLAVERDADRILAVLRQLAYVRGRTGPLSSSDF